jgi:hypothetical protein
MRECFMGQNVIALGNGIAILQSRRTEAETISKVKNRPKNANSLHTKPAKGDDRVRQRTGAA